MFTQGLNMRYGHGYFDEDDEEEPMSEDDWVDDED